MAGTFGIAATPSTSFLYTSDAQTGSVSGLSIGKGGELSLVGGSPFPLPDSSPAEIYPPVDDLAMHPSGKFLYVPDIPGNEVAGFAIDSATGNLTGVPGSPFPAGNFPLQVAIVPSGAFLYSSNYGDNTISAFTIDASTGTLAPVAGSPFPCPNGSPDGLAVHPSGKFLYVVAPFGSNIGPGIAEFNIDPASGALTAVPNSPVIVGSNFPGQFSIAQDPSGKYLYALGYSDGKIWEFSVDSSTGALTPLVGSPYNQGSTSYWLYLTIDPSGKFLYYSSDAADLGILKIDASTGELSPASPSYAPAGFALGLRIVNVTQ